MPSKKSLAQTLAWAAHYVAKNGLVKANEGNVSARLPNNKGVLIKPSGFELEELTASDFIIVDLEGRKIRGRHQPSYETPMHTTIYRKLPHVNSVIHTHSPVLTAMGIAGQTLEPTYVTGLRAVSKGVPIVPFLSPGSQRLADAVADALAPDREAAVLKNHGCVTVGACVKSAATLAVKLEGAARIQLLSSFFGKPSRIYIQQAMEAGE